MSWWRALVAGLLLCGWGLSATAQEAPPASLPDRMQMDAYLALFRGDEARDEGRLSEAALAYSEAADGYRALQSTYPDHQPSMVTYRLAHADRELAAIEQEQPESPVAVEVDGEEMEREQLNALRTENRYLRQKLLTLEDELERGEEPSPEHVEELRRLSQRDRDLSMTASTLRKQLEASNVDRTELRAAQQEARELKSVVARQRSQLSDQRKQAEDVGALREQASELKSRNRQLELAIKGAEQEANTIRRLEEELRVQNSKGQMLLEGRNRLADEVKAMTRREETLQEDRQRLQTSQSEAQKALAASLKEAQTFMERSGQLEDELARSQASLEQVRGEQVAAHEAQEGMQSELAELEAELQALRQTHIKTEAQAAELRQQALEARNLGTKLSEMEQAQQAELVSVRQAQAEAMAARAEEFEREREVLMTQHAAALEEEIRLREEQVAEESARNVSAVSNLVAKHAADLAELKSAMQALKDDLQLALDAPVPSSDDPPPVTNVDEGEMSEMQGAAEEAELKAAMLEEELEAAREAVREAWAERDALLEGAASTDELRRTIAGLTEERAGLQQSLDESASDGESGVSVEAHATLQRELSELKQVWEAREAEMVESEKELIRLRARLERIKH